MSTEKITAFQVIANEVARITPQNDKYNEQAIIDVFNDIAPHNDCDNVNYEDFLNTLQTIYNIDEFDEEFLGWLDKIASDDSFADSFSLEDMSVEYEYQTSAPAQTTQTRQNGNTYIEEGTREGTNGTEKTETVKNSSNNKTVEFRIYDVLGRLRQNTTYDSDGNPDMRCDRIYNTDDPNDLSGVTSYSPAEADIIVAEGVLDKDGREIEYTEYAHDSQHCIPDEDGNLVITQHYTRVYNADGSYTQTNYDAGGNVISTETGGLNTASFNGRSAENKLQQDENGYYVTTDAWDSSKSDNIDCASRLVYNMYGLSMYDNADGTKIHQALIEANPQLVGSDGQLHLHPGDRINLVEYNPSTGEISSYGTTTINKDTPNSQGPQQPQQLPEGYQYTYDDAGNVAGFVRTIEGDKETTYLYGGINEDGTLSARATARKDVDNETGAYTYETYNNDGETTYKESMNDSGFIARSMYDYNQGTISTAHYAPDKNVPFSEIVTDLDDNKLETITYEYDSSGNLTTKSSISEKTGYISVTKYNDPEYASVTTTYDGLNELEKIYVKEGGSTTYRYYDNGTDKTMIISSDSTHYMQTWIGTTPVYIYDDGTKPSYITNMPEHGVFHSDADGSYVTIAGANTDYVKVLEYYGIDTSNLSPLHIKEYYDQIIEAVKQATGQEPATKVINNVGGIPITVLDIKPGDLIVLPPLALG